MLRLFKLRDDAGTEMYINLDHITTINIPNELMSKPGQLTVAQLVCGPVTMNMTVDIARKIAEYLQDNVVNNEELNTSRLNEMNRN